MNLWATAAQAAVGAVVQITVGLYYRRLLRLRHDDVERILQLAETVAGITSSIPIVRPKGTRMIPWDQYRKGIAAGIAAGVGLIFTGVLTWATTDHVSALEQLIEPAVPEPLRPLLGVAVGGIVAGAATVKAVVAATNAPAPGPVRSAGTISTPALPTTPDDSLPPASSAGTAPAVAAATATPPADEATAAATVEAGPFWAGVPAGAPTSSTSLVDLPPAPVRNYQ